MKRFSPFFVLMLAIVPGILISLETFSQESGFAPINPEFIRHLEFIKSQAGTKSSEDVRFADIPSPLKLNFSNYKKTGSQAKSGLLPARFDLRDSGFVTPIRNQGNGGTCWAFANIAAIETNWLVTRRGAFDLSEQNLAACNGINRGYNDGGEGNMGSAYFTRLSGPLLESDDPYIPVNETALNADVCKPLLAKPPFYVLTSRFLPADHELIKRTVMQYGGLHISMFGDLDAESYNAGDYTYYNAKDAINWGHGVVIIGWDDNKPVTGGTKSPKGTKGAWIIKNSWGPGFGEAGYFYISYYDHSALSTIVHFDVTVDTTEFDKINMYDELGASRTFGFGNEIAFGLTRFNAPARELVKMVGTYVISANSYVDIEIYDTFSKGSLSGLLYSKKNIPVELPGQRVFNVAAEVEGDYYVKIKYYTPTYSNPLPVEAQVPKTTFLPPVIMAPGTNWISSDGEVWESIGSRVAGMKEMDLTIRTYTSAATKTYGFFELPKRALSVCDSLTVFAELSDSSVNCQWQFLPDGLPMLDSGRVPAKVKFATPGPKRVLLILSSEEGIDTIVRSVNISNKLDIEINASFETQVGYTFEGRRIPTDYPTEVNKPIRLSVAAEADSFRWSPPYETENKAEIYAIADHEGPNIYYVTAFKGNCTGSDTITVDGYTRPENDDIEYAIELHEGRNGPFTNYFATVEEGEPSPPTDPSGIANTWRMEGGLQNSIWFWFVALNDSLRIYADGMYDQFAVYKAALAGDLKNGNNTLIATYDNSWVPANYYTSRIYMKDLEVGEKYWLQFDGGLGGSQEKISMGLYYPKYFYAPIDTIYLDKDSNSVAQFVIEADSAWQVIRNQNCSWIGLSPAKGIGKGLITVFSKSTNDNELTRKCVLLLKSPYYETKSILVLQDGATRVRNNYKQRIVLYPNPTSDELFIKGLEGMKTASLIYVLHDISGRVIHTAEGASGNRISVTDLTKGLYFLEIRQDRQVIATIKFIKD